MEMGTRKLGFNDLGISGWLCRHIGSVEFNEPTEVQKQCIPVILAGMWQVQLYHT